MKTHHLLPTQEENNPAVQEVNLFAMSRILSEFNSIGLEELDKQRLQDRVDTKFLFDTESLPQILSEVQQDYAILEINHSTLQHYLTLYFDTQKFNSYFDHHNGKRPRFKVRMRKYTNSGSSFLEVKEKDNKDRTIKSRMAIRDINNRLTPDQYQFINQIYGLGLVPLKPVIWNRYKPHDPGQQTFAGTRDHRLEFQRLQPERLHFLESLRHRGDQTGQPLA